MNETCVFSQVIINGKSFDIEESDYKIYTTNVCFICLEKNNLKDVKLTLSNNKVVDEFICESCIKKYLEEIK